MTKRLILLFGVLITPLILGLLFTYDVIKINWVSMMEVQPSFRAQEDPLPLPARSIPVDGAVYIPGLGAPVNPVDADDVSLHRGEELYAVHCALCHGASGEGNGPFAAFLENKPANLLEGNAATQSDGAMFIVISNGIPGRMPSMRSNLPTARDRWDVVNFIRSLQQGGQ